MKIASVDPGGRTGVVVCSVEKPWFPAHEMCRELMAIGTLRYYNMNGKEEYQTRRLYERLKEFDVVIIEDFRLRFPIRSGKDITLSPVRIGFGLSLLLRMSNKFNGRIVWQQPTQLGVITDQRLRAWDLWLPGEFNKDIRSAMKHLLIYLRAV